MCELALVGGTPWYWEADLGALGSWVLNDYRKAVQTEWNRVFSDIPDYAGIEITESLQARLFLTTQPSKEELTAWGHKPHQCMFSYWPLILNRALPKVGHVRTVLATHGPGYFCCVRLVLHGVVAMGRQQVATTELDIGGKISNKCGECGDDTTVMNDYPHHKEGCSRIGLKYTVGATPTELNLLEKIDRLSHVALTIRTLVLSKVLAGPSEVIAAPEFKPVLYALERAGLVKWAAPATEECGLNSGIYWTDSTAGDPRKCYSCGAPDESSHVVIIQNGVLKTACPP